MPFVIGIAGASCAGKSELTAALVKKLHRHGAVSLGLDSYYRDLSHMPMEERERQNFDLPEALDGDLLAEQVGLLARGETIQKPVWRFDTHTREPFTETVSAGGVVVVEGIFALYREEVRRACNLKVFVEVRRETAFARRLVRDTRTRGSTREYVVRQFETEVEPMFERYVLPTKPHADLLISGDDPLEHSIEAIIAVASAKGAPTA